MSFCHKSFNLGHNFWTAQSKALIQFLVWRSFQPCNKRWLRDLDVELWLWIKVRSLAPQGCIVVSHTEPLVSYWSIFYLYVVNHRKSIVFPHPPFLIRQINHIHKIEMILERKLKSSSHLTINFRFIFSEFSECKHQNDCLRYWCVFMTSHLGSKENLGTSL